MDGYHKKKKHLVFFLSKHPSTSLFLKVIYIPQETSLFNREVIIYRDKIGILIFLRKKINPQSDPIIRFTEKGGNIALQSLKDHKKILIGITY